MSLSNLHKILAFAYFLPPLFYYLLVGDLKIGNVEIDDRFSGQIVLAITSFFVCLLCSVRFFTKNLSTRLEKSLAHLCESVDGLKLTLLQILCMATILFYLSKILVDIQLVSEREALFKVFEKSIDAFFILVFKVGIFLSTISLLKKRNYLFVLLFVFAIVFVNILTQSRSMILVLVIALLPFFRLRPIYVISGLTLIFVSRFILSKNISLDADWWRIHGFGEMLAVTFGPYAILESDGLELSLVEYIGFILHTLPGFSMISTYILKVPELTIYVNNFTSEVYGLYGVAGTGYLDVLAAPILFIYLCIVISISFLYFRFAKESGLYRIFLSCAFIACAVATVQLYRWSLSGFVYTTSRDFLIFIFIFFIIRKGSPTRSGLSAFAKGAR